MSAGPFPRGLAVLRHRPFALLWAAQLVSTVGTGLTTLAASLLVFRATGSAAQVGLLMLAGAAPGLVVGLVAGAVGDRRDRARTMILCDLGCAAAVALIPVLVPWQLGWLFVLVAATATLAQFFAPAQASLLPDTVPDSELAAANSLMTISQFGALALGYAGAGLLTTRGSLTTAFTVDAATFVVSAGCIRFAGLPTGAVVQRGTAARAEVIAVARSLRGGLRVARTTPVLRSLLLVFGPIFACYALANALALTFALRALHASEAQYSAMEIAFSAGFVASSLALAGLADRLHPGQWVTVGVAAMGLASVAFAAAGSVPLALALSLVVGVTNAPPYLGRQLLVQRWTPREARARVNSVFFVVRDAAGLVGMALAGLADVVEVRLLLLADAVVLLGCAAVTAFLPGVRGTGHEWRRLRALLRDPGEPSPHATRPVEAGDVALLQQVVPAVTTLDDDRRRRLLEACDVLDVPAGTAVIQLGDPGTAAFVLLRGRVVATLPHRRGARVLEVHTPGDIVGEIAALTGSPRTATVVAEEPSRLLRVPSAALRVLVEVPGLRATLLDRVSERLGRTALSDLPRFPTSGYAVLRELEQQVLTTPAPTVG